ncbi:hypothetical protein CUU66_05005 [Peribacillus deserti]|uniref:Uncharacterized protein n=1 Tax=Peribacillus deserti TaxID=673318 RepID=A0A2N5M9C2_9BACI|nr:hypothetical protein CUU66_05005 [Peribacillus deserti]
MLRMQSFDMAAGKNIPCGLFMPRGWISCGFFRAAEAFCGLFMSACNAKEVICMTIHMLFFTIIVKPKEKSPEESFHQEHIQKWHNQNRDRMLQIPNVM